MKQITKYYLMLALVTILTSGAMSVFAANVDLCTDGKPVPASGRCPLENPAPQYLVDEPDFKNIIVLIVRILLVFAGAIAVIFLIVGGYQYVASRGNEETMERAKRAIQAAIIGIIIIVMAYAIVVIVNNLLVKGPLTP